MIKPTIILIGGLPRHGKSTLAALLATFTGFAWCDCSFVIYEELALAEGVSIAALKARDKNALRADLIRTGDQLCEANPAYLAEALINRGIRIVSGIRRVSEMEALKEKYGDQYKILTLWVEAFDSEAQAEVFAVLDRVGEDDDSADGPRIALAFQREKPYSAPTIKDNTETGLRQHADLIVVNPTLSHLAETARFITARYV